MPRYRLCTFSFGASDRLGVMPQGIHTGIASRDKRPGLMVLPSDRSPELRRGADPSLYNQTCSLRAAPACCTCASLELRILISTLREQPAHVCVPSQHLYFVASDHLGIMHEGRHAGIETG